MIQRFNPTGIWPQRGRAFNHGVAHADGVVIHVTGQVAWDEQSTVIGIGDAGAQMEKAIDNVRLVLAAAGGRLEDIVSMTIYYLQPADLPEIQRVRSRHFPPATAPASILVQVAGLVAPELLVEVVPIAVVPAERFVHSDA